MCIHMRAPQRHLQAAFLTCWNHHRVMGGIAEATLVPVDMGIVPLAVWSEKDEGQGDKKCHEVEEAVIQEGGRR